MKNDAEMSTIEGKQAITFSAYRFLADKAMRQTGDFRLAIFAWIFLVLAWNLIARCISVSSLMLEHITWEEDSMVVIFPTHKGDKEGKNCTPKHVYANPKDPVICPIFALAVYVFTMGLRREGSKGLLFYDVDGTENRFSKWLKETCRLLAASLLLLGIFIIQVGTHSFRKGVATFLSSIVGGPTAISIYLRAGWSLGFILIIIIIIIYNNCTTMIIIIIFF